MVSSCEDPGHETAFSETFVELVAAGTASGALDFTYLRENDGVNKASGFMVSLASVPLSNDVTINFEVVAASTDAIENVHYVMNGSSVTIPAGQNLAELPIDIIADNIEAGEIFDITIRLTSADVRIEQGLDEAVHRIQISCPSALAGTYDYVSTEAAGNNFAGLFTGTGTATLTAINDITYTLEFADAGAFTTPQAIDIRDICGTISENGDNNTAIAIESGSVDGVTGVVTITFNLTCCGGEGDTWTYVMTPQ